MTGLVTAAVISILSFTLCGVAATLLIKTYWTQSLPQLFLGFTGTALLATGITTTVLETGYQTAVVLAGAVTAAFTGVLIGIQTLDHTADLFHVSTAENNAETEELDTEEVAQRYQEIAERLEDVNEVIQERNQEREQITDQIEEIANKVESIRESREAVKKRMEKNREFIESVEGSEPVYEPPDEWDTENSEGATS